MRQLLILACLLTGLAWPGLGWGAIAVTDTTTGGVTSGSTLTFAHVVASGDTAIYVGVGWTDGGATTISTITWNTTENLEQVCIINNGNERVAGWMIVNPTVGTLNIVVTWPEAVAAGVAGAISISGGETASVAAAHRTAYTNTGSGTGATVTVVDSVADDLVVDSTLINSTAMGAVGAGQTSRAQDDSLGGGGRSWGMSTEPATGGNTVMSWANTNVWATCATALTPPFVAGTGTGCPLMLLGVGRC